MKRTYSQYPWIYNPFTLSMDFWSAFLQMGELAYASDEVIRHRSRMMTQAASGNLPLHHYSEFITMWQEKLAANSEAWMAMTKHMQTMPSGFWNARSFQHSLKGLRSVVKPYHTKSKANALRLRKKK